MNAIEICKVKCPDNHLNQAHVKFHAYLVERYNNLLARNPDLTDPLQVTCGNACPVCYASYQRPNWRKYFKDLQRQYSVQHGVYCVRIWNQQIPLEVIRYFAEQIGAYVGAEENRQYVVDYGQGPKLVSLPMPVNLKSV